jgi:Uma2 family endonuclease
MDDPGRTGATPRSRAGHPRSDVAGWREGRLIDAEDHDEPFIPVAPDCVAEVLSPGTARIDRVKKMPIYARERVGHVWLVDATERTIEVFRMGTGTYSLVGTFGGNEQDLALEPFGAAAIPPVFLWGRRARQPG